MKMIRGATLVLAGALALASCTTLPPWKSLPTGSSVVYGQIEDFRRGIAFIAWSDDPGIITLTVENRTDFFNSRYGVVIDQPARATLREILAKYGEWSKLAVDNQVEITREINSVTLPQMLMRNRGWEAEGERQLQFVFNARLGAAATPRTSLLIRSSSFFYGADPITLNDQQAADFAKYLDEDQIAAGYQQAKKKQDALELFK
jgi:hypothetical protein